MVSCLRFSIQKQKQNIFNNVKLLKPSDTVIKYLFILQNLNKKAKISN